MTARLDAATNTPLPNPVVIRLPETVVTCPFCKGVGTFSQRYIEGRITGTCDMCLGAQFVYRATAKPVTDSVRAQIATTNGMLEDLAAAYPAFGFIRLIPSEAWRNKQTMLMERENLSPMWTEAETCAAP